MINFPGSIDERANNGQIIYTMQITSPRMSFFRISFYYTLTIKIFIISCFCCISFWNNLGFAASSIEGIQVYQKNLPLPEERKQRIAEDIDRYNNAENLWDVLRQEFGLQHYENNPQVQEQIDWFMNHQDFLLHSTTHAAPYLYYILQQAHKRHLPAEFALLPIIESAYNPFAYSPAGAAGIWQMMPGTASGYGLRQDFGYDGRRDVITSTKAALNYLAYLNNFFEGNWLLTIAAYNTGEGSVLSSLRRNIRDGITTDFWYLPLPQETRVYVPRLLALATIIAHPEIYPIYLPPVRNAPYLAQIDVDAKIDLKHAALLAGISIKQLWQLNPGYNRSTTTPPLPFKLVLPIENVEQFTENLARLPSYQRPTAYVYKVRTGDSLKTIADRFYTSPLLLRKINQLVSNNVKAGMNLIIPRNNTTLLTKTLTHADPHYFSSKNFSSKNTIKNTISHLTTYNNHYKIQSGDTIYMSRRHDSLPNIAKQFHTSVEALAAVNQFSKNRVLQPGERLLIPTHRADFLKTADSSAKGFQLSSGDIIYMVRASDTIEKIAKKFHTTPARIRIANLMNSNRLHRGDRLVIPMTP